MHKLWRGSTVRGPVLSTVGWIEAEASRALPKFALFRTLMPALRLRPPPSDVLLPRSHSQQSPTPIWRCVLPRQARAPPSAAWLSGGRGRSFRSVEAVRNREKDGSLEGAGEEGNREEESGGEEDDGVLEEERKSSRAMQQRLAANRSRVLERGARGGGSNAPPVGSLELLEIPGVGPRNLRKLVDKGFQGVAQLKQLYRDKDKN